MDSARQLRNLVSHSMKIEPGYSKLELFHRFCVIYLLLQMISSSWTRHISLKNIKWQISWYTYSESLVLAKAFIIVNFLEFSSINKCIQMMILWTFNLYFLVNQFSYVKLIAFWIEFQAETVHKNHKIVHLTRNKMPIKEVIF